MKYNLSSLKSLSHKFNKSFCLLVLFTVIFDFVLFNIFLYVNYKTDISLTWGIAILTLIIVLLFSYFILRKKQWAFWIILISTIAIASYYLLKIVGDFQFLYEIKGLLWTIKYRVREIFIVMFAIPVFIYFLKVLIEQRTLSPTEVYSSAVKRFDSFPSGLKAIILWFIFSPLLLFWLLSDFYTAYQTLYWISISVGIIFSWLVAYFLYKRKNWMRILLIVLSSIGIVLVGIQLAIFIMLVLSWGGFNLLLFSSITLALLINVLFIWYLSRKRTKTFFVSV